MPGIETCGRGRRPLAPLIVAMAALVQVEPVDAASYDISFSGHVYHKRDSIYGVPGAPTAPITPQYQIPRLGSVSAPGWRSSMDVSIDAVSGEVTDFRYGIDEPVIYDWFSALFIAGDEQHWLPANAYHAQFNGGTSFCQVTNPANDDDGLLVFSCPTIADLARFSRANMTGVLCATSLPYSTLPQENRCQSYWAGLPTGENPPETATIAGRVFPANASIGGLALSVSGTSPPFYRSLDHAQNHRGVGVIESAYGREGALFHIFHTGTLADGDFTATGMDFFEHDHISFEITSTGSAGGSTGTVFGVVTFQFDTVTRQQFVLAAGEARAVPAFGLLAVLVAVLATGVALNGGRRV